MLIGLGGGAASSVGSGASSADLDFASVQRGNAEIQRRAQEVIDSCWSLGKDNPIVLIHGRGCRRTVQRSVRKRLLTCKRGAGSILRRFRAPSPACRHGALVQRAQERYV